jgi:hypothetical protein
MTICVDYERLAMKRDLTIRNGDETYIYLWISRKNSENIGIETANHLRTSTQKWV